MVNDHIEAVLGDREFANKKFFSWLIKQKINFYIRIKGNSHIQAFKSSKHTNLKNLFRNVHNKKQNYYPYSIFLWKLRVFVAAGRSEKGELMIIVTNADPKNAVPVYMRRWEIECLFQALKNRGFHFEETHFTDQEKLKKLIAVLAVATAWCIKVGEWRNEVQPIPFNKHRDSLRPQYTFFRYGLDFLSDALVMSVVRIRKLKKCLRVLKINQARLPDILTC